MRHFKIAIGLTATVLALAVSVAPALAHEFTASKAGALVGRSEEAQNFKFGAFKITCEKALAKGKVAAGASPTFATAIKYTKCSTAASIGAKKIKLATHFHTPLAIEYHANGFVEAGSELEEGLEGEAVLAGGEVEVHVNTGVTEEHHTSKCTIHIPEQTIPLRAEKKPEGEYTAATFSTIPGPHGRNEVLVTNAFTGIKVEFEGEPCEEFGKEEGSEQSGGTYKGSFPQELHGGIFEFN
jgi:hypothetical protein